MAREKRSRQPDATGRLTSAHTRLVLEWVGVILAGTGLIVLGAAAAAKQEWVELGAVVVSVGATVAVAVILWRRHSPSELSDTSVFRPFATLNAKEVWPRKPDADRILETVDASESKVTLVVGASGVGKSVLLEVMVRQRLAEKDPDAEYVRYSDEPSLLTERITNLLDEAGDGRLVLILDQFEQWLANRAHEGYDQRAAKHAELARQLQRATNLANCQIVIGLRRDWYFELRFLGDLVPNLANVCEIQAPVVSDASDPLRRGIRESFQEVLDDDDLVDKLLPRLSPTGRLSPLKAQVVGAVLERRMAQGEPVDLGVIEKLGGLYGVIDTYFEEVLAASARPDVCMKILYALSVKLRLNGETPLDEIIGCLFESRQAVTRGVQYLVNQGLVAKHSANNYAIAHDFLAEFFIAKSGSELHPVERDSIQFFAAGGGHSDVINAGREEQVERRLPFGVAVVTALSTVMILRFFYFGVDTTLVGPSVARPLVGSMFDATYLLILVPYAAWIFYVAVFYDRLLAHLKEGGIERALSIFVVLNLILSVLLGIVIPFAWLVGIASGGIVFAAKMLRLSRNGEISRSARERLGAYVVPTILNLVGVAILGVAALIVSLTYVETNKEIELWIILNLGASAMMTYWCIILAPRHITRRGISQMLGLIGRPRSLENAYFEA
jgi:hypothetical protein